jgi:hypothetical protein
MASYDRVSHVCWAPRLGHCIRRVRAAQPRAARGAASGGAMSGGSLSQRNDSRFVDVTP